MTVIAIPLIPLIASLVAVLSRRLAVTRTVTTAAGLLTLILSVWVASVVNEKGTMLVFPNWIAVDGLSSLILVLQGFLSLTAALFSWGYMKRVTRSRPRERWYYVNLNLFIASLFMVPIFLQPALTWVAVELTTILSVFLVSFENTPQALEAAWKYTVITIMGATVAVFGIFLLIWGVTQQHVDVDTWATVASASPHMSVSLLKLAFVFIFIGFGTKVGIVPMHTWLPDAHSQAPSAVCALLSGIEVSTILYVIMRLWPAFLVIPGGFAERWALIFGLISVATSAFLMIQVKDYKRLFAFSTVEQMGILLVALGLGAGSNYALLCQLMTHALTKSLTFYSAGAVLLVTSTLNIANVRGLIRISPIAGTSLLFSGLAIGGAPPFALFLSELSIFKASLTASRIFVLVLLLAFLTLAFIAILRHLNHMVFGKPTHARVKLPRTVTASLILSWIPVLVLGVYFPGSIHHWLTLATVALRR